jgi:hypothetical protein
MYEYWKNSIEEMTFYKPMTADRASKKIMG